LAYDDSTLHTNVPSGILLIGNTFPVESEAFFPQNKYWPLYIPSAAIKFSYYYLYLYGSLKETFATGAPRPESCVISLTTPRI
jgi:hypothetical protein